MASRPVCDQYEQYITRFASDSGLPLIRSLKDAARCWGLRRLSRKDFERWQENAAENEALLARWAKRLHIGYDREKAELVREIEDIFADAPYGDPVDGLGHEHAA